MSIQRYGTNGSNSSFELDSGDFVLHEDHLLDKSNLAARLDDAGEVIKNKDKEIKALREALELTRGQWIHSVNAKQCLKVLGVENDNL